MVKKFSVVFCAIAFGLSCAVGYYLNRLGWSSIILFALADIVLFISIYCFLKRISNALNNRKVNEIASRSIGAFFEEKTFVKVFLLLLIMWFSLTVIRYPGIESGGVRYQIQQFMGMDTLARQLSPVIYDGHFVSGHHPVLLTYIFGIFIKMGMAVGNSDLGMFLLSCFICILNALGVAYVFSNLYHYLSPFAWGMSLCFLGFNPMIASLNTYVLKDNLFATALFVYCISIFKILRGDSSKNNMYLQLFLAILIPFLKNQGIYIVIITNVVLLVSFKDYPKLWKRGIVWPVLIFVILFQHVLMPLMHISPGGKQEMLSLMVQMTANTINEHKEQIDEYEMEIITAVFAVDDWGIYTPENADNIKFQFNQNSTGGELLKYFEVWLKQGIRYPKSYIEAFFRQTYGYYCVDHETSDWNYKGIAIPITEAESILISEPYFSPLNAWFYSFIDNCIKHERFKYFFNIAVSFWLLVFTSLIGEGKKENLLWVIPIYVQWLICLLSPVNGSGRYGIAIYEMAPIYFFSLNIKRKAISRI